MENQRGSLGSADATAPVTLENADATLERACGAGAGAGSGAGEEITPVRNDATAINLKVRSLMVDIVSKDLIET